MFLTSIIIESTKYYMQQQAKSPLLNWIFVNSCLLEQKLAIANTKNSKLAYCVYMIIFSVEEAVVTKESIFNVPPKLI